MATKYQSIGERHKKNERGGHIFKARNIAETRIFEGCNNSKADSIMLAHQEPILEVVLMAKELGYWSLVVLTNSKNTENACKNKVKP